MLQLKFYGIGGQGVVTAAKAPIVNMLRAITTAKARLRIFLDLTIISLLILFSQ